MSLFTRELAKEGIRQGHPEWSEIEVASVTATRVAASSTLRPSVLNDSSRHFCINESKRHHWPLPHI
jgi:hypothetical protein